MMTSYILKSVDFTKTQKSRYLENKTFFLQVKNYTSRSTLLQKINLILVKDFINDEKLKPNNKPFKLKSIVLQISITTPQIKSHFFIVDVIS